MCFSIYTCYLYPLRVLGFLCFIASCFCWGYYNHQKQVKLELQKQIPEWLQKEIDTIKRREEEQKELALRIKLDARKATRAKLAKYL
jgi:hypothetical protein